MSSLNAVRARFSRNEGLPFANILTETSIRKVLNDHGVKFRDRVYSPITTIWGFLAQVLSEDHSCRDAVSRIIAHRVATGKTACSPNAASYCNARSRILTDVLCALATQTAEELQTSAADQWKWNGRSVFIFDGSSVSMPDTPENQAAYPQPPSQQPGIGFPLARIGVLLSLATGACHNLALAPYRGKGTGETSLFRRMYHTLNPGDVVLADALFDDYFIACELCQRDIDIVAHAQYERTGTWAIESRPDGDILVWHRPQKPRGMTREQYRSYPERLLMREVTVDARDKNNRAKQFKVVTTILDLSIDGQQIGSLYERRWDGELDIRSIKSTMQMDILRCKTPDMVHKEIWTHLLAYNLLRTVMAVAANEND
ncbi:MAG: IS4 family transposase, partial [Bythopirellula sp.]